MRQQNDVDPTRLRWDHTSLGRVPLYPDGIFNNHTTMRQQNDVDPIRLQ